MVRCPQCGTSATGKFCPNCGTPLPQTPPPGQPVPPYPSMYPQPPVSRRGGSKWLKWVSLGIGAATLLVVILIVIGSLLPDDTPGTPAQPATPSSQPAKPAPAPSPGNAGQKAATSADAQYFVSRWRCWSFGGGACPAGWEELIIKADGTYTLANNPGTWKVQNSKAVFDGPLAFAGAATPKPPDQFQLDYNDKSGFGTYILFVKW